MNKIIVNYFVTDLDNLQANKISSYKKDKGVNMIKKLGIYKCEECGSILEVLHESDGTLACCDKEMKFFIENTVDAAKEKHIPVVEIGADGIKVKVGSIAHPMEEKHYIEWIEIIADNKAYRQFLKPGQPPEAYFCCEDAKNITVREYCNLHGLWKN
jgi:superoxide reductase